MPLRDILAPGLRVVIVGTIWGGHRAERVHYYAGAGNSFWTLLHRSGLTPVELAPSDDHRLPEFGIGVTDLVAIRRADRDRPAEFDLAGLVRALRRSRPSVVAFVSKTASATYARVADERLPRDYEELSWPVAGRPSFVLPGPSGANNGMPLALRAALWRDLLDFVEEQERS